VTLISGSAFTSGVERHRIDGVPVRTYSPAKTPADCFKFRNKIGLDAAIGALREALRAKRCTREELWAAARLCRVTTVIRPHLEDPERGRALKAHRLAQERVAPSQHLPANCGIL
jgi:hypothetical protein